MIPETDEEVARIAGARKWCVVGSSLVADVIPRDLDILILDLCGTDRIELAKSLKAAGFVRESDGFYPAMTLFQSWRRGGVNILVVFDQSYFDKFRFASEMCARYKVTDRADRVAIHAAILYGRVPHK